MSEIITGQELPVVSDMEYGRGRFDYVSGHPETPAAQSYFAFEVARQAVYETTTASESELEGGS